MEKILHGSLRVMARVILATRKPIVIAIAGSVGKTSTKEAVYQVVSSGYTARKAQDSYNNELGVPLTIIGATAQGKNALGWLFVFLRAIIIALGIGSYPKVLVLELGEQHPGDIAYLMNVIRPKISVLTSIARVHTEFFKNIEGVRKELANSVKLLSVTDKAVINGDDERVAELRSHIKASVIQTGTSPESDMYAESIQVMKKDSVWGLYVKLVYRGTAVPLFISGVPARHQVYAALHAAAVGTHLGMNFVDIGNALNKYRPPRGRTNMIDGIHKSTIIDDTYNASPIAARAAIRMLSELPRDNFTRRVAVLGEMLELGDFSIEGHRLVGIAVAEADIDVLVTVGSLGKYIAEGARERGLDAGVIHECATREEAEVLLKELVKDGDVVLIKGSQGARMEKLVKALMRDPDRAEELLVRQSATWLRK